MPQWAGDEMALRVHATRAKNETTPARFGSSHPTCLARTIGIVPSLDRLNVDVDGDLRSMKEMPVEQLPKLARKIRDFLVEKVCQTGGHLGSNLGAVELTIALHRVFDSPRDLICFDTGH